MTTPRTPLRQDDITKPRDMQRPLNEAIRGIASELDAMPRREQAWVLFSTPGGVLANQQVKAPNYPLAGVTVLRVLLADGTGNGLTAAPYLALEPVDGWPNMYKVANAYGLPTSAFHALLEFVEDTTGGLNRGNPTGGVP